MRTARCLNNIAPYLFVGLNKKKKAIEDQGHHVISLAVGDPDVPTPSYVLKAMVEALKDPANLTYPDYAGIPEFRNAAAAWMGERFGVSVNPDTQLLACIGSKEGLAHLHVAFVDPDDYVLVPSIGYPVYSGGATLVGGHSYFMPMNEDNHFLADFTCIPEDVLARAKVMFLGYPNNPTGATAPEEYFDSAIAFCKEHDLLLAHDNAYCDICYDSYSAPSILQRPGAMDCCIEFFSLSKSFNMTGWRLAFAVGNETAIRALSTVKNNIDSGQFRAIQKAGIVALQQGSENVERMCRLYQSRRDRLVAALNQMGLSCNKPLGSIYLWAKVPEGFTSESFVDFMLEHAHVMLTPGSGYGPDGEGFIRISLSTADEDIDEALKRMRDALRL